MSVRDSPITEVYDLPRSSTEVARRLQKRLSAFALSLDSTCRDIDRFAQLLQDFQVGVEVSRREVAEIAARLFDAREVLG